MEEGTMGNINRDEKRLNGRRNSKREGFQTSPGIGWNPFKNQLRKMTKI